MTVQPKKPAGVVSKPKLPPGVVINGFSYEFFKALIEDADKILAEFKKIGHKKGDEAANRREELDLFLGTTLNNINKQMGEETVLDGVRHRGPLRAHNIVGSDIAIMKKARRFLKIFEG